MEKRVRGATVIAALLLLPALPVRGAEIDEEMDEAFLHFRYQGVVEAYISGLYDGERIYLPLVELFEYLQLDYTFHPTEGIIEGFFVEEMRRYRIDLAAGSARIGNRTLSFSEDDFVATELDVFFLPEFFEQLFNLRFTVTMRRLTLGLATEEALPVVLERERARRRARGGAPETFETHAPLLFERDRRFLAGGFFDYSWTSRYDGDEIAHSYFIFGGGELLGGDLQGGIRGGTSGRGIDFNADDLRWRYVFEENPFLTQFLAGGLFSTGLLGQSYRGIRLTNQPVEPRRLLDTYRLQGTTEPGWDVELYLNNRLVESVEAGATGEYSFDMPLRYGTQQTTLRFFGPTGEFQEVDRRFNVPFLFLPPGEVNYSVDAGQTLADERDLLQASAAVGATERLTAGVGVDYTETLAGEEVRQPVPYHTLSYRAGDAHIASFENAPDALQRLSLHALYPNQAAWEAQLTRFRGHPFYGPANARGEGRGSFLIPFLLGEHPLSFRFRGRAVDFRDRETEIFYNPELDLRYRRGLYSFGVEEYRGARAETRLVGGFRYSFAEPALLRHAILRASYRYDPRRDESDELLLDISRSITRNGRLRTGWRHHFPTRSDQAEVSFTYDFPAARSTTTYRQLSGAGSVSQNLRGSIGYDAEHNRVIPYQRPLVGTGGVAFRPFVDYAGTGTFDEGDEVIEDRIVRFREPVATRLDPQGVYRAYSLTPYRRYSVEIDKDRIRNPFWVPRAESFSFVTDPNRFKVIDLPFYVSGVIEGTVLRENEGATAPVSGMRLVVRQLDGDYEERVPIFFDGSYYQMGLPPGDYEIQVDPVQLERIGAVSKPGTRRFEIRITRDGDYVDGLDFLLRDPEPDVDQP